MKEIIRGKVPSKSNSYRSVQVGKEVRFLKSKTLRQYEENFAWQCRKYRGWMLSQKFLLILDVYFANPQSDLDGCFKVVLDCLQTARCIKNDNLCYRIQASKHIDKLDPRVEFEIIPLT